MSNPDHRVHASETCLVGLLVFLLLVAVIGCAALVWP